MSNHVVNDIQQHINYNELLDDNKNTKLIKVQYFKKRKKLKIIIKLFF